MDNDYPDLAPTFLYADGVEQDQHVQDFRLMEKYCSETPEMKFLWVAQFREWSDQYHEDYRRQRLSIWQRILPSLIASAKAILMR